MSQRKQKTASITGKNHFTLINKVFRLLGVRGIRKSHTFFLVKDNNKKYTLAFNGQVNSLHIQLKDMKNGLIAN